MHSVQAPSGQRGSIRMFRLFVALLLEISGDAAFYIPTAYYKRTVFRQARLEFQGLNCFLRE